VSAGDQALTRFLDAARTTVDEALERYLPKPPACPALLSEAMRYSLFAGGKRLRPILALAAADAAGDRSMRAALPAACAIEFIHTYSLIHDDLPAMDNDTLRRGRATNHVVYGDGIAILAGDGLQAEAFALLAREPASLDPDVVSRKLRVARLVAEAAGACGMVGGQVLDLHAADPRAGGPRPLDREGLRDMHLRKTGALIRAAAEAGAIMGGGADEAVAAIGEWAAQIGLAFQIVDDILDVEGEAAQLGKTAGKDAASAKPTYPALYGLEQAKALAAECADRAHIILERHGLNKGWLDGIAQWIVARKN
jgi:geranylgeranyl diphosphate synthase type II